MRQAMERERTIENENLECTRAIFSVWKTQIVISDTEKFLPDLEDGIQNEALREWGEETLVKIDRDQKAVFIAHPDREPIILK